MNLHEAKALTEQLMDAWLGPVRSKWSFQWKDSTRGLGWCKWNRDGTGYIMLNNEWVKLADADEVKETILHEIGHAIAGNRAGHSRTWRLAVQAIGGNPTRITNSPAMEKVLEQSAKYVAICPTCGDKHYIARLGRVTKSGRSHCSPCARRYGFSDKTRLQFRMNL